MSDGNGKVLVLSANNFDYNIYIESDFLTEDEAFELIKKKQIETLKDWLESDNIETDGFDDAGIEHLAKSYGYEFGRDRDDLSAYVFNPMTDDECHFKAAHMPDDGKDDEDD